MRAMVSLLTHRLRSARGAARTAFGPILLTPCAGNRTSVGNWRDGLHLIPFASFFVSIYFYQPLQIQSGIIAIILAISLAVSAFRNKLEIPLVSLPYLAMPLILFASINEKLEFASDNMILCFSMLAITILLFSQKDVYNKWLFRNMLVCGNLHLAVQIFGIMNGIKKAARDSVFPLPNEIMFFYMLVIFSAALAFRKDDVFWKKYAAVIGALAFVSIALGDPGAYGTTKSFESFSIGSGDAVGIWLGLGCGALFASFLFLWRKLRLPRRLAVFFTALILSAMMLAPIIAVNSSVFSPDDRKEATTRLVNWQAAWSLIKENPLGIGFGSYGANIMQHWPVREEAYYVVGKSVFTSAHNQYMQILAEIGWLGLVYYCALFALPWLLAVWGYLKTGEARFLFVAAALACMLSVMEVAEAISMFAFIQTIHWGFLICCAKHCLCQTSQASRVFRIRLLYVLPLLALAAFLLFDRGRQLHSMLLSAPAERAGVNEENAGLLGRALEIHPKNAAALWYTGHTHLMQENYEEALKAMEAVEEISGWLWPVRHIRAEAYYEMGDLEKAREQAAFPIARFRDRWTQELKEKLERGE